MSYAQRYASGVLGVAGGAAKIGVDIWAQKNAQQNREAGLLYEQYKTRSQGELEVQRDSAMDFDNFEEHWAGVAERQREQFRTENSHYDQAVLDKFETLAKFHDQKLVESNKSWATTKKIETTTSQSDQQYLVTRQRAGYASADITELHQSFNQWYGDRIQPAEAGQSFELIASDHIGALIDNGDHQKLQATVTYLQNSNLWTPLLEDQTKLHMDAVVQRRVLQDNSAIANSAEKFAKTGHMDSSLHHFIINFDEGDKTAAGLRTAKYQSNATIAAKIRETGEAKTALEQLEHSMLIDFLSHRQEQLRNNPYQYAMDMGLTKEYVPSSNFNNPGIMASVNHSKNEAYNVLRGTYKTDVSYFALDEIRQLSQIAKSSDTQQILTAAAAASINAQGNEKTIVNHINSVGSEMAFAVMTYNYDPRIGERLAQGYRALERIEEVGTKSTTSIDASANKAMKALYKKGFEYTAGYMQSSIIQNSRAIAAAGVANNGKTPSAAQINEALGFNPTKTAGRYTAAGTVGSYNIILPAGITSTDHQTALSKLNDISFQVHTGADSFYIERNGQTTQLDLDTIKKYGEWRMYDYGRYEIFIQYPGESARPLMNSGGEMIRMNWDAKIIRGLRNE